MATPPPNLPVPGTPSGAPNQPKKNPYLPGVPPIPPKAGGGVDAPDPFAPSESAAAPSPAGSKNVPMPEKTTQPNPLITPPGVPTATPSPLAPPVFQQAAKEQKNSKRGIFLGLGIFLAVAFLAVGGFFAYTLLKDTSSPAAPTPSFAPVALESPLVIATPTVLPTPTPTPAVVQESPAALQQGESDDIADEDEDELTNAEERFYGTNPRLVDTDGDGYTDGEEVRAGYDPLSGGKLDSDNDGFPDPDERQFGSDPFHPDTDGDGYSDGDEIANGHNPLIPAPNDKL